ncbi:MAG: hypothetical protein QF674_03075 [Candidatus Marinimicrobia bacterium]|jgi:hypothetical protein|nr:hypothetical protein [Candidatus Neomarinimicrobiota bacterium]MDP7122280.1 hypothetical protein [Candidatus Neomarinimicrobiota bacterium]MDP7483148.1 hypothetical protein [Candidatus Neomarinimicrobiota bacterium]MDP7528407.1 hypothetical protein [Candidatus Neomarinimicrobiota bacterium]MDP7715690.1 hypothetical protein [Candidatus Neomarinimicrobiota bacterium]|tara:strand:+ start:2085 stop:2480 length:396 start_codon:yes stop_codon:yes gene_type:complete
MSLNRFSFILIVFCFGSWFIISWIIIKGYIPELFLGMIVPLVIGLLTVTKIQSIFTSDPGKLTSFMIKSFIGKLVIYGVYMIGIVAFSSFNERPFFISFIGYFITLHVLEAFFIRSVFKGLRARDDNSGGK